MRKIQLTQGQEALVDDDDFERLNQFKWCAHFQPRRSGGGDYNAVRNARRNGKMVTILMHREVIDAPEGSLVDHRDRNALNNQKANLRLANHTTNGINQGVRKNNRSGYKGVAFETSRHKYTAKIKVDGRTRFLGRFDTAEAAAHRYNLAAVEAYGDFAFLNAIPNQEVK